MLSPEETQALLLSLRVSLVAVTCALPFALAAALLLARRRFPGKALVDGALHLPLVLPPVVIGYLLLIALGTRAPVGGWFDRIFGIRFVFSLDRCGAGLGHHHLSLPGARHPPRARSHRQRSRPGGGNIGRGRVRPLRQSHAAAGAARHRRRH